MITAANVIRSVCNRNHDNHSVMFTALMDDYWSCVLGKHNTSEPAQGVRPGGDREASETEGGVMQTFA